MAQSDSRSWFSLKPSGTEKVLIAGIGALILVIGGYQLLYKPWDDRRQQAYYDMVRKSIALPEGIKQTGMNYRRTSSAGLPHYAPTSYFQYTYDPATKAATYLALKQELVHDGFAITGDDVSTPNRNVGASWYLDGQRNQTKDSVMISASGNRIEMTVCRNDYCS